MKGVNFEVYSRTNRKPIHTISTDWPIKQLTDKRLIKRPIDRFVRYARVIKQFKEKIIRRHITRKTRLYSFNIPLQLYRISSTTFDKSRLIRIKNMTLKWHESYPQGIKIYSQMSRIIEVKIQENLKFLRFKHFRKRILKFWKQIVTG